MPPKSIHEECRKLNLNDEQYRKLNEFSALVDDLKEKRKMLRERYRREAEYRITLDTENDMAEIAETAKSARAVGVPKSRLGKSASVFPGTDDWIRFIEDPDRLLRREREKIYGYGKGYDSADAMIAAMGDDD